MALVLPAVFYKYLSNNPDYLLSTSLDIEYSVSKISRAVAIISLIGYLIYLFYQTVSHDGLLHEIYEADDHKDNDRHEELAKPKLTLTEVVVALLIALACVALIAIFLVEQIPFIVEHGVSDAFVGLILVPLVEKLAGMYNHLPHMDSVTNARCRTSPRHRRSVRQPDQHGPRPRHGCFHPDRAPQCSPRRSRRLGHPRRHELQLRHVRRGRPRPLGSRHWLILA